MKLETLFPTFFSTLLALGLSAAPAAGQAEAVFSAAYTGPLSANEIGVSSPLTVQGWTASIKEQLCFGSWKVDSFGTVTTTRNVFEGSATARDFTGGIVGCGGGSFARFRSAFEVHDLVFESTDGQTGTVSVTLPALATVAAYDATPTDADDMIQNVNIQGIDLDSPGGFIVPWSHSGPPAQHPVDVRDLTLTRDVVLGQTYRVRFSVQVDVGVERDIDPPSTTATGRLELGNLVTGELFELPPGITVNAPSMGLADNVVLEDVTWEDLGFGMPGTGGLVPSLEMGGPLIAGTPASLTLRDALPNSVSVLVFSTTTSFVPFLGGTLVPYPTWVEPNLPIDPFGEQQIGLSWPAGLLTGTELYMQHWIFDPGAPFGYSASNGVRVISH